MNNLQVIEERIVLGKEFKIYGDIDNPLFLAKDVAEWIEYDPSSVNKMLMNVDEDEKLNGILFRAGQNREMTLLTEDGLYEVLMLSKKPIAKEFKKQVKQILKQIRKTGGYIPVKQEESNEEFLARAFLIAQETLKKKDLLLQQANETIEVQKPKVEYHDTVLNATNLLTVTDISKDLSMSARKLNKILHDNKIIYPKFKKKFDKNKNDFKDIISHWIPYSDYEFLISECYADYKISSFSLGNNNIGSNQQLCFTEKGRKWIIELLSNLKINS